MEYLIIVILIIILMLLLLLVFKSKNEASITERLGKLEINVIKEVSEFKSSFAKELREEFSKLKEIIEKKLADINDRVNEKIDENFKNSNKIFISILERLATIDEAQKKIDSLSGDIVSLQNILTDKKTRGIFGEVNLTNILFNVFGSNDKIYKLQYPFDNGTIVDCALFAPEPLGIVGIDSKFPLENYRKMIDKEASKEAREIAFKLFRSDVKKHIDAISEKYIIKDVTSDQAIMFIPAEAIFAEINAYHQDIIEYAYKNRVWLASPTTLISTLTTIQVILKNIERDKYTSIIHQELNALSVEFSRYKLRWDKLYKSIETVSKDVKDIYTTTDKITKKFETINQVQIENKEEIR